MKMAEESGWDVADFIGNIAQISDENWNKGFLFIEEYSSRFMEKTGRANFIWSILGKDVPVIVAHKDGTYTNCLSGLKPFNLVRPVQTIVAKTMIAGAARKATA